MLGAAWLFLLSLLSFTEAGVEKCDIEKYRRLFHEKSELSKVGCFICSKPICNFEDKNCNRISRSPEVVIEDSVFEGGFLLSSGLQKRSILTVKWNDCWIAIEVLKMKETKQINFLKCLNKEDCYKLHSFDLDFTSVLVFTLAFYKNGTGVANFQADPSKLEFSSYRKFEGEAWKLKKVSEMVYFHLCPSYPQTLPSAWYEFHHSYRNEFEPELDGVAIMVPCSNGGFAIDPKTKKLAVGKYLKEMTNLDNNIEIANALGINPTKKFDVWDSSKKSKKKNGSLNEEKKVKIDDDLTLISFIKMMGMKEKKDLKPTIKEYSYLASP